jgi:hypothetical protein
MNVQNCIAELEESVDLANIGANVGGFPCNIIHTIVGFYIVVYHS